MSAIPVFACSGASCHRVRRRAGARAALSAVVVIAVAPLLQGCTTSDAPDDHPATGQLVVQLTQPGPHGEIFHLNNAIFDIIPAVGLPRTVDGSGFDAQVTVAVDPGIASVELRDGWRL
jgi:hypothetical protein